MRHKHGLLALVLKLYLVLFFAQVASAGGDETTPTKSNSATSMTSKSSSSGSESSTSAPLSSSSLPPNLTATPLSSSSQPSVSMSDFSRSRTVHSRSATNSSTPSLTSFPLPPPSTPLLPTDSFTSPDPPTSNNSSPTSTPSSSSPEVSPSSTNNIFASSRSNKHVPIIAGVVTPVVAIIFAAIAFALYKRRQRTNDRREWERTHASIADAVRQVGSPVPGRSITPYAGSGAWSHMDTFAKGSGDTVTDPYTDRPVTHQSAEYTAFPVFRAAHSPTLRAAHSPTLSQSYSPFHAQEEHEPESRPASTTESSIPVDTSYGHDDDDESHHAI